MQCNIYCTQVCGSLLQSMGENRSIIENYKDDYTSYKTMFNEGFWKLLKTKGIDRKLKVKLTFVYFNAYGLFLKLKKIV